jgi:hypothetical protein
LRTCDGPLRRLKWVDSMSRRLLTKNYAELHIMSDDPPKSISDEIDGLKFLSETHRTLHDQRRKTETKVFFTTLSLYVLPVTAKFSSDKFPSLNCHRCIVWICGIALWGLSSGYLWKLHEANRVNKRFAQVSEDRIMEVLSLPKPSLGSKQDNSDRLRKVADYLWQRPDWLWQSVIIFLFMVACSLLLTTKLPDVSGACGCAAAN